MAEAIHAKPSGTGTGMTYPVRVEHRSASFPPYVRNMWPIVGWMAGAIHAALYNKQRLKHE